MTRIQGWRLCGYRYSIIMIVQFSYYQINCSAKPLLRAKGTQWMMNETVEIIQIIICFFYKQAEKPSEIKFHYTVFHRSSNGSSDGWSNKVWYTCYILRRCELRHYGVWKLSLCRVPDVTSPFFMMHSTECLGARRGWWYCGVWPAHFSWCIAQSA